MSRVLIWITAAALGAAAALMASFGLLVVVVFLSLAVPLIARGDRLVALSGLLTGFGALWSSLIAQELAIGGTLDDAQFWTAVGVLPLVIGCVALALAVVRESRRSMLVGRS